MIDVRVKAARAPRPVHHFGLDLNIDDDRDQRAVAVRLVGESKRVLEVARAEERVARALRARDCHVAAVERDRAACAALRRFCTTVIHGDVQELHLAPYLAGRKFDVVALGSLLQEAADPVALLRRVAPFLAEGGAVVASIANVAHASVRLALLGGALDDGLLGRLDRSHLRLSTLAQIERTFAAAGFALEAVERVRVDPFDGPSAAGPGWDETTVPRAVRLLIERDPEALVAYYVVRATRVNRTAVRGEALAAIGDEVGEQDDLSMRTLITREESLQLEQVEREAVAARRRAEERAEALEAELAEVRQTMIAEKLRIDAFAVELAGVREHAAEEAEASARRFADARQALEEARQELRERDNTIDALRGRVAQQGDAVQQLTQELSAEQQRRAALRTQLEAGRRDADHVAQSWSLRLTELEDKQRAQVAELERALAEAEARGLELTCALETTERALEDREVRLPALEQALTDRDARLASLEETAAERKTRVATLEEIVEERSARVRALEATVTLREAQLVEGEHLIAEREDRVAFLEGLVVRRSGQVTALERALADGEARAVVLTEKARQGDARVASLEAIIDERDARVASLEAIIDERDARVASLEERALRAEGQAASLESIVEERDERVAALEQAMAERDARVTSLEEILGERDVRLAAAEGTVAALEERSASFEAEIGERNSHASALQSTLVERDGQVAALEQKIAERDAHLGALEEDLAARQARMALLERAMADRGAEIARLEFSLDNSDVQISVLQGRLEEGEQDLQRTQRTLLGQVAVLSEQLRDAERRLGQRDSDVEHLEQELDKLQRAARFLKHGLEGHATHLESELGRIRSSLAFRMASRCDQAKGLLLPEGSRRRAVFDRVVAFARSSTPGPAELEPPRREWSAPKRVKAPQAREIDDVTVLPAGDSDSAVLVQERDEGLVESRA